MKRAVLLLAVLTMCLWGAACMADKLTEYDYIDVPAAMTQDAVLQLRAGEDCGAVTLPPDEESVALLDAIYQFVWVEKNRPARFYDEQTQRKIAELAAGVDIDVFHMTETMRMQLSGETEKPVTVEMLLDVDYRVGQTVVVVMGVAKEPGEYAWYPYRGHVEKAGEIRWEIPAADWAELSRQPVSFQVLTDRIGARGGRMWGVEEIREELPPSFSKDSGDVTEMRYWYSEWGEPIEDNFSVWLVDLTKPMQEEVARIGEHLAEEKAILDYFPEERREEALLMLPETVDQAALIPYDIIALCSENYKDTYGDVSTELVFGTAYQKEKAMVVLAGFPIEDAEEAPFVEWYVLRAEALLPKEAPGWERPVEIGLKQLIIPRMEKEPLMMIVISEPLDLE